MSHCSSYCYRVGQHSERHIYGGYLHRHIWSYDPENTSQTEYTMLLYDAQSSKSLCDPPFHSRAEGTHTQCPDRRRWYRNDPATIDFYKGNRIPTPAAQINQKITINKFLNLSDDELEGKTWLCGDRFSAADIHFYGLMSMMRQAVPWLDSPTRKNVAAYISNMDQREASQKANELFGSSVSV